MRPLVSDGWAGKRFIMGEGDSVMGALSWKWARETGRAAGELTGGVPGGQGSDRLGWLGGTGANSRAALVLPPSPSSSPLPSSRLPLRLPSPAPLRDVLAGLHYTLYSAGKHHFLRASDGGHARTR